MRDASFLSDYTLSLNVSPKFREDWVSLLIAPRRQYGEKVRGRRRIAHYCRGNGSFRAATVRERVLFQRFHTIRSVALAGLNYADPAAICPHCRV